MKLKKRGLDSLKGNIGGSLKENISGNLKENISGMDMKFLVMVYALLAFGLIMVLSASSPIAYASKSTGYDSFYYFKKQLLWAVIGTAGLFGFANYDYRKLKKYAWLCYGGNILVLLVVLAVGKEVNGAKRWLQIGGFSFQPTEFSKALVIVFYAYLLSETYKKIGKLKVLFIYGVLLAVVAALIMLQPHMSCTILIISSVAVMLFVAGMKWSHISVIGLLGTAGAIVLAMTSDYRRARMLTFLEPFKDIQGDGWQIVQSLYAIGSGGILGAGLGQSRQKFMNIPEPQNDFIFSILAEELGILGCILVIVMFIYLIYRGIKIALNAPDLFGKLLASGIMGLIAIQVFINIAVVTSTMPVTGMPLPFFSYGGTALAVTMWEMGIVLSISRYKE